MQNFRELQVWKKSHALTVAIYKATTIFPKEEIYGLTSQMRRAAVSVAANIAEGCGRGGKADFARFIQMALGSASELEYLLLLSCEIQYLNDSEYEKLSSEVIEVKKMLTSFMKKLKANG
ncbi:MAG: four helix bundle protein [Thermodesulfovibrionales bacterium]